MPEKRPSLLRVIQTDQMAFIFTIFMAFFWIFYIYDVAFKQNNPAAFLPWVLGGTVIAIVVVAWRYTRIRALFGDGVEVKATVNSVAFFRDRGQIAYIYTYQGQKYLTGNTVMKTGRTKAYQPGSQIDILVDRNNPRNAVIRDLFI